MMCELGCFVLLFPIIGNIIAFILIGLANRLETNEEDKLKGDVAWLVIATSWLGVIAIIIAMLDGFGYFGKAKQYMEGN